jgi:hypothetical protein
MFTFLLLLMPLALVAPAPTDVPPAIMEAAIVRTHNVARLPAAYALRLEGKRARYRVVLDSSAHEQDGYVLFDCQTGDGTHKTIWLLTGEDVADVMEVEARLVIRHYRAWTAQNGTHLPAFTEFRLMNSRRCR